MAGHLLRVALTGGIATGKSVCLRRLAALGAPTIDADVLARDVVAPGSPQLRAIAERFGNDVLKEDGTLDRARLGQIVFGDREARTDLERIIHPAVYYAIAAWLDERERDAARGGPRAAVADIPLLYETGREREFDRVIVAACPAALQLERLMTRDGLSEAEARRRLAAQLPIDLKRSRADVVIDTSGTIAETEQQVDRVWAEICG